MSADTSDDFFLNFGSSTNVNDELRHSLRQEVSDIDVTISKIEEESGKETRVSQELRKGLSHADKEMFNLSRGSRDLVDSSNMNDTLRRRMNDDLQADLVSVYLVKGKNKSNRDENIEDTGCPNTPTSPSSVTFVEERHEHIKVFAAIKSKFHDDTVALMDKKRQIEKNKLLTERRMETEKLSDKLKNAEDEVQEQSKELEKEQRRFRITKEAVHDARTKSGMHAQEIADFTRTLTNMKVEHAAERKKLADSLAKEEAELSRLQKDDAIEKAVREKTHLVEIMLKKFNDSQTAREKRAQVKERRSVVEKEAAFKEDVNKKEEEAVAKKRLEKAAALAELEKAKSLQEQAASQKAHNEHVESEKIIPGKKESQDLKKEKISLAQRVTESSSEYEAGQKKLSEKDKEETLALEKLVAEAKALKEQDEGELAALVRIKSARDELWDAIKKECAENQKIAINFAEASAAEKTRLNELEVGLKNDREKKREEARVQAAQHRQEKEELLEVMSRAADLVKELHDEESELKRLEEAREEEAE